MQNNRSLNEGLSYKDMVGLIKPTIHVDEFVSKMGEDDDIMTLSFYVKSELVAEDLVNWFEKGYDYILDADRSPGEIKPSRFLVFVEVERRTRVVRQIKELIEDLETLCEFELDDWTITFQDIEMPYNAEELENALVLSPRDWRQTQEGELNEMRTAAGLPTKPILTGRDKELDVLRSQAGIL